MPLTDEQTGKCSVAIGGTPLQSCDLPTKQGPRGGYHDGPHRCIHCEQCAYCKAELAAVREELAKVTASRKQFLEDTTDDMECLPECDSYGHAELCPATNPAEAWRKLREERGAANMRFLNLASMFHNSLHVIAEETCTNVFCEMAAKIRAGRPLAKIRRPEVEELREQLSTLRTKAGALCDYLERNFAGTRLGEGHWEEYKALRAELEGKG